MCSVMGQSLPQQHQDAMYLDFINLMTYDLAPDDRTITWHNSLLKAPLNVTDDLATFNAASAVEKWIQEGASPSQLVLGIPLYGNSFRLQSSHSTGLYAPVEGLGRGQTYTRQDGFLAYYEVCELLQTGGVRVWDQTNMALYMYRDNYWAAYDDALTIQMKVDWLKNRGLGGAMVWALDFDDFSGSTCSSQPYPLLTAINKALGRNVTEDKPETGHGSWAGGIGNDVFNIIVVRTVIYVTLALLLVMFFTCRTMAKKRCQQRYDQKEHETTATRNGSILNEDKKRRQEDKQQDIKLPFTVLKVLVSVVFLLGVLFCLSSGKVSIISISGCLAQAGSDNVAAGSYSENMTLVQNCEGQSPETVINMIFIMMMIPYTITFLRCLWVTGLKDIHPWPTGRALVLIGDVSIMWGLKSWSNITPDHPAFDEMMINIFCGLSGYLLAIIACSTNSYRIGFALPLLLGNIDAVLLVFIAPLCETFLPNAACQIDEISYYLAIRAAICIYIANSIAVWSLVAQSPTGILENRSQIFLLPGYNSMFLEQWLVLSRRTKFNSRKQFLRKIKNLRNACVYVCSTMYHESAEEMEQLLLSLRGIANDLQDEGQRHFESHIFFDGGCNNVQPTAWAQQLITLIEKTVCSVGDDAALGSRWDTPYGLQFSWTIGLKKMPLIVHLKDKSKVRSGKRWSQVMYMSYILNFSANYSPLGMSSGAILNDEITASSPKKGMLDFDRNGPHRAR
ncbi:CHIT1 [Branchiostoma lanceolatum]|uniref:CHIT1 protein n=1 Tax=Branchiostoma lanceolatum TaxID=7740 RepID=A0A8K0EPQ6_BRALA|nr:CHIT1 [Branchiostoma lanceolatum]